MHTLHIVAVMVHTPAPADALAWYRRAFPAARHARLPAIDFEFLQVGEVQLEFVASDDKVGTGPAGTVVYWQVDDFDRALAHLLSVGATRYRGPMAIASAASGWRRCRTRGATASVCAGRAAGRLLLHGEGPCRAAGQVPAASGHRSRPGAGAAYSGTGDDGKPAGCKQRSVRRVRSPCRCTRHPGYRRPR